MDSLCRGVDYAQYRGFGSVVSGDQVIDYGVVIDAVALMQDVLLAAIFHADRSFQHIENLFSIVRGAALVAGAGVDVNEEGLHVAVGLGGGERHEIHVGVAAGLVTGEGDGAFYFVPPVQDGTNLLVVVEKGSQADTQRTGNFNKG